MKGALRHTLIHCPKCGRGSLALPSGSTQVLRCAVCAAVYPVDHGVIDLLPGGTATHGLVQRAFESERLVDWYESRWWRQSAVAAFALGMSVEQECRIISRAAKLQPGDMVLDLACGTGLYTRPFAQQARPGLVLGLDVSSAMLHAAAQLAHRHRLKNVILIRGTAQRLPFPSERFDVVNCCSALHLFQKPGYVLREIHRVLKPGGRFTAGVPRWYRGPLGGGTAELVARMIGIYPLSSDEFEARCCRVGLRNVKVHHASRLWLVMSARKPVEGPPTRAGNLARHHTSKR